MICQVCSIETTNPKFCSRSCAAKVNNVKPKRGLQGKCHTCSTIISSSRKYCIEHKGTRATRRYILENGVKRTMTLAECRQQYSGIRNHARRQLKNIPQVCIRCGYDKHVQAAHIRAITTFPPETLLGVVNHVTNLMFLCPNCHWEYDHGLWAVTTGHDPATSTLTG